MKCFLLILIISLCFCMRMIERDTSYLEVDRLPCPPVYSCLSNKSQETLEYSLFFNNTASLEKNLFHYKQSNTVVIISFSAFKPSSIAVTNYYSTDLSCVLIFNVNSPLYLNCSSSSYLTTFVVYYTISLIKCSYYCSSISNSPLFVNNLISISQTNSVNLTILETDYIMCPCVSPPPPPPPFVCTSCQINKTIENVLEGSKMVIQSEINSYAYDGSCCAIFDSANEYIGKVCKDFPQHWTVRKSMYPENIGELRFTFPTNGTFFIRCCSNEDEFEKRSIDNPSLGPMMGPLNFYITNYPKIKPSIWICPPLPPSNVTSKDVVVLAENSTGCYNLCVFAATMSLSDCKAFLQDIACSPLDCNETTSSYLCDNNGLQNTICASHICPSFLSSASFLVTQKTLFNSGFKQHKRISLNLSPSSMFVQNINGSNQMFQYIPVFSTGDNWIDTPSVYSTTPPPPCVSPDCSLMSTKYYTVSPNASHSPLTVFYQKIKPSLYHVLGFSCVSSNTSVINTQAITVDFPATVNIQTSVDIVSFKVNASFEVNASLQIDNFHQND